MIAQRKFPVFISIGLVLLAMGWQDVAAYNGKFPGKGSRADWARAAKMSNTANQMCRNREFRRAIDLYRKAICTYPYDADFYINLAVTYDKDLAQPEKAEAAISDALRLAPHDFDVHWTYAQALFHQRKYADARNALAVASRCSMNPAQRQLLIGGLKELAKPEFRN